MDRDEPGEDDVASRREGFRPSELEVRILTGLAAGSTYSEIADEEFLSRRTLRRIVQRLKRQTGSSNLAALCAEAITAGWVELRVPPSNHGSTHTPYGQ
jgi:DNA-binding NarL/FixJ family response regulator